MGNLFCLAVRSVNLPLARPPSPFAPYSHPPPMVGSSPAAHAPGRGPTRRGRRRWGPGLRARAGRPPCMAAQRRRRRRRRRRRAWPGVPTRQVGGLPARGSRGAGAHGLGCGCGCGCGCRCCLFQGKDPGRICCVHLVRGGGGGCCCSARAERFRSKAPRILRDGRWTRAWRTTAAEPPKPVPSESRLSPI